jgi:hypothetical protein
MVENKDDICDRLVDIAKAFPSLHFVLKDAYDEITELRRRAVGLQMQIEALKGEDAKAFQQAIFDAIRKSDLPGLMATIEARIDERIGEY